MDPNQMMFPMWGAPPPPLAAMPPPSDDPSAAPNAQPFSRGWKRKSSAAAYQPPALGDLQVQNRAKARRWFKNSNSSNPNPNNNARKYFFPKNKNNKAAAPRNTTSFIIRAKRAGGIASLVSPCPVTPAVLPTPRLSPTREGLADMAQAQWGVDGYGSMKGLIRLRSSPKPASPNAATSDDDGDDGNSSGSDVEEHVEVERRLDHDLSRFEMVYPGRGEDAGGYVFEDDDEYDQDAHVARLEEENLTLKERLFLMEQEVGDMRRRLEALEARFSLGDSVGRGENAVAEAPPGNDSERINVGSENSSEDDAEGGHAGSEKTLEHDAEKQKAVGSDKSGEHSAEKQGQELPAVCSEWTGGKDAEKQGAVGGLEKTGEHNAEKQGSVGGLEKAGEHNAEEHGAVGGLEKTGEHNAEELGAVGGLEEKAGEHNAEKQGAVGGLEKTGEHNADKQGAVGGLEKTGEDNAEKQGAVGTEKTGEHDIEMVDSASEKTVED
ncbi:hypothetical protein U9M48_021388 [Paspalum notatum var. saurae]|uniref:PRLI-interacting factor A n=1 Tax=Paspalum notatum var. saurae TaxID=547442 RepID=A0AAQ3TKC3_PASNO